MANPDPDAAPPLPLDAQIAQLRADMARIAETLAGLGRIAGDTLRSTLADKADAMGPDAAEKIATARHKAEATMADMTDYARRNPGQALARAGGLGLLLGLMFGRR